MHVSSTQTCHARGCSEKYSAISPNIATTVSVLSASAYRLAVAEIQCNCVAVDVSVAQPQQPSVSAAAATTEQQLRALSVPLSLSCSLSRVQQRGSDGVTSWSCSLSTNLCNCLFVYVNSEARLLETSYPRGLLQSCRRPTCLLILGRISLRP